MLTTIVAMATGDFNGDAWADLVIAEKDSNSAVLWLNDQTGRFSRGPVVSLAGTPLTLAAADLTGDTHLDLIATLATAGSTLVLCKGDGGGGFDAPITLPIGGTLSYLRVGDLNDDDQPDLVVSSSSGTTVAVLLNEGNLAFATTHHAAGSSPQGIALGDFDHDGVPDLAVAGSSAGTAVVSVLIGAGDGSFAPRVEYSVSGTTFLSTLEAGDCDGDLHDDLVVSHAIHGAIAILWNDGSGAFVQQEDYPLRSQTDAGARLVLADFDGDGRLDIAATDVKGYFGRSWISFWLNRGNRVFDTSIRYWVGTGLGTSNTGVPPKVLLSLEDVDHVGRLDLIVGLNYFQSSLAELLVIRHRVGRLFDGLTDYELADGAGPLAAVDFHATGKHDLLMSRGGHLWRLDSDANGAFAPPVDLGFGALARALDFNDDGRTDVLQSAGPPLSISLCDASGALLAPDTYASRFRASGDFDGDGLLDLLGEDSGGMLETLLNDGTGHFDTPNPAAVNLVGASPIGTGDVDGDTHVDLVVARKLFVPNTATVDSLTVLRSQGDGTFTFLANYPLPPRLPQGPEFQSLEEVFVSDLNGDQLLDVIVATKFAARIGVLYVLIGDGAGGFGSATPYDVTPEDPEVALVDADRDGDPDLVVTAHSGEADGRMQVFANRGNGTFVLPYFQGIETYPGRPGEPRHVGQSVVTGDFNADGSPDVAFPYEGYNYTDGIGVFLGRHSDIVTPVLVSLVDATVSAAGVRLEWYGASAGIPAAHVQRRVGDTWSTLATILRDGTGRYVFDDRDVEPGVRYVYRLQLGDGPQALFSEETVVDIPLAATLRLERPTPNPSVGELHVSFTLSSGAPATLEMTDVGGRRVRAVTIASPEPRRYTLDLSRGGRLAPGIYWVRLTQREESAVTRAVVLR